MIDKHTLEKRIKSLEKKSEDFDKILHLSLFYLESDPESSLSKTRTVLEKILIDCFIKEMGIPPKKKTIELIIGNTQFQRSIPKDILVAIRTVQGYGNIGVHHSTIVNSKTAYKAIFELIDVMEWYIEKYISIAEDNDQSINHKDDLHEKILLAREFFLNKKYDNALEIWNSILENDSKNSEILGEKCITLIKLGNKEEAREIAENYLEKFPLDYFCLTYLGWYKLEKKLPRSAREILNKAISIDENQAIALHLRGILKTNLKEYKSAVEDCIKAIKLAPNNPSIWLTIANAFYATEHYESAIEYYSDVIEINDNLVDAWNGRGLVYEKLNQKKQAIADFSKAIEINQQLSYIWHNRGLVKLQSDFKESCISDFSKALKLAPENAIIWKDRGKINRIAKHYDSAIFDFDKAIEINPTLFEAWNERGIVKQRQGKHESAIEDFTKSIELNPNDDSFWEKKGYSLQKLEKHTEAIKVFSQALALNPKNGKAFLYRGNSYDYLKKYNLAIKDFVDAINNDILLKVLGRPLFRKGEEKVKLDQYETAILYYSKSIDLNPSYSEAWRRKGDAKRKLKQYEYAIKDYSKAIELKPDSLIALHNRGLARYDLNNYEAAIMDFSKAIEIDSNDFSSYYNRGLSYECLKDFQNALKDFEEAIKINPISADSWNRKGVNMNNIEHYEKAILVFTKAIELAPLKATFYLNRGVANRKLNRYVSALNDFEQAIENSELNYAAMVQMGIAYSYIWEKNFKLFLNSKLLENKKEEIKKDKSTAFGEENFELINELKQLEFELNLLDSKAYSRCFGYLCLGMTYEIEKELCESRLDAIESLRPK